jgi:alkylation response protein AidB-like acyl-CoA dehydrogenase
MDPATLALESATAFTAALALLLSRLDVRHQKIIDHPDVRERLWKLAVDLADWKSAAEETDRIMELWARGNLTDDKAVQLIYEATRLQITLSDAISDIMHGIEYRDRRERERSLRNLLRISGPDVSDVLTTAIDQRHIAINELTIKLPSLRAEGYDAMQATVKRLHFASEELARASTQLDSFVRDHFPPT